MRPLILTLILLSASVHAQPATVGALVEGLRKEIRQLARQGDASAEYGQFKRTRGLKELDYYSYLKSKVTFECSRDAGLWHIEYRITDQQPDSRQIWSQWRRHKGDIRLPTAQAECDEVSALYAVLARRLGVKGIGLFWPTNNHTVAVWKLEGQRVVVPTTPIFLERYDGFDAQGFDPETQPTIYDYTAQDVNDSTPLPEPLVRFFLSQVRNYGGASRELLHELRYLREAAWYGQPVRVEYLALKSRFTNSADQRALKAFARQFRQVHTR